MLRTAAIGLATLSAAAVALAAPGVPGGGSDEGAARPAASARSGSFAQSNSRSGMPVLSATNLGPGDSTTGSVSITNTGTLAGDFILSAHGVTDVPGPNGGLLSNRLHLAVLDVTRAAPVYSGPLAAMPPRPLGRFGPSEARTYRFTATFPDGGSPVSAGGGDNAYSGSSASVSFSWSAVAAAAAASPSRSDPGDRRPPRLRLSIPRLQRVLNRGYLLLRARCDERCRVGVSGTVRVGRGRPQAVRPIRGRRIARGRWAALRVRLPARASGAALRRALLDDRGVTVRLRVVARDRAGNRAVARRTVRLSRR